MKLLLMALIIAATGATGCATRGFPPEHQIVNFDRVDAKLYRGAQPNANGIDYLKTLGVTRIINLRMPKDCWPQEAEYAAQQGMEYFNVPMNGVQPPSREEMARLQALIDSAPGKVFVHCQFGCDRTGITVGCYRINHGETPEAAFADAKAHGISALLPNMREFLRQWRRL